jgi:hypothetical protein
MVDQYLMYYRFTVGRKGIEVRMALGILILWP